MYIENIDWIVFSLLNFKEIVKVLNNNFVTFYIKTIFWNDLIILVNDLLLEGGKHMELTLNNSKIYTDSSKIKSTIITLYLLFHYVLIYFGLFSIVPIIISYIINAILLIFFEKDELFYFLVGLAPFAGIYNFGPNTTSLFTFLFLEATIILFIKQEKNHFNVYILIFIFAAYIILRFTFDYQNIIKLICNILLVYFIASNNIDFKKLLYFFIFGFFLASILGIYKEDIPELTQYFHDLNYYSVAGKARFSGLMQDPNYYTIALFVVLFSTLLLYYNNSINKLFWLVFIVCSYFGFLTISKSFILMYVIFLMLLFIILLTKRKKFQTVLFLILLAIFISLSLSGKINSLNYFYLRLFESENTTFLTGRDLIWKDYLEFFRQNPLSILIGVNPKYGLIGDRSTHNLYIEMVYHLGIIGSLLFVLVFVFIFIKFKNNLIKRKILNYIPFFMLLIMFFFLSMLFNYLFSFYLVFMYYLLNLDLNVGGTQHEKT